MNTIWIDLTDLLEWKGHYTGIQRVTYNYAYRFSKEGARFFVYSSLYDRFIEVPFTVLAQFEKLPPKRKIIKQKLRAHYTHLPLWLKNISGPFLRIANKSFRKAAALILDRQGHDHLIRNFASADFAEHDTVLLLGAGWNNKVLIKKIAIKKKEYSLHIVVHLNDILPIYQPHLFAKELPGLFSQYVYKALKIADVVTVISNATKQDVLRYCAEHALEPLPIKIIKLGEDISTTAPIKPSVALEKRFILCVGTLEIRKNYILLYQAVKLAQQEGKELPQIIIAGRRGWLTHDLQYVLEHDPAIANRLVLIEGMSDKNLSWLYENCIFTVFCSLAEGWGLPIAESLQHGKFCVASNTSSMPEIAGNAIDYFNPFDARSCLEKIVQYSNMNTKELARSIKKQYLPFTWDSSFDQLKKALNS